MCNNSQFLDNPIAFHYKALHRVLRYIKSTPGQGLLFKADNEAKLATYCDSDGARYEETKRSVTVFFVFLGSSLICCRFKKQTTIAKSSPEAEYKVTAMIKCEIKWMLFLLRDLGVHQTQVVPLYCD